MKKSDLIFYFTAQISTGLSFWNNKNEFVMESGYFQFLIDASSEDIRQAVTFKITNKP